MAKGVQEPGTVVAWCDYARGAEAKPMAPPTSTPSMLAMSCVYARVCVFVVIKVLEHVSREYDRY